MRGDLSTVAIGIVVVAVAQLLTACSPPAQRLDRPRVDPQDIQKQAQDYFNGKTVTIGVR